MTRQRLPNSPADRWEDYFDADERLIWQGAPTPGFKAVPLMIILTILGIPFFGFGLLAVLAGLRQFIAFDTSWDSGLGLFLAIFGIPFAGIGAALIVGPWYATKMAPHKVRYALSNRRAYIAKSWWNHNLETYVIAPDDPIELVQGKTDTVWFHTFLEHDSDGAPKKIRAGFENIADGPTVYAAFRKIQKDDA